MPISGFPAGLQRTIKLLRPSRVVVNNATVRSYIVIGTFAGVLIPKQSQVVDNLGASVVEVTQVFYGPPVIRALTGDHVLDLTTNERFRVVSVNTLPIATHLRLVQTDVIS